MPELLLLIYDDRILHEGDEAVRVVIRMDSGDELGVVCSGSFRFEEVLKTLFIVEVLEVVDDRDVIDPLSTLRDELMPQFLVPLFLLEFLINLLGRTSCKVIILLDAK